MSITKEHLIEASGRKEIQRVLSTHSQPVEALLQLRRELGLSVKGVEPALALLDVLQVLAKIANKINNQIKIFTC
jgi:hypothetical protein